MLHSARPDSNRDTQIRDNVRTNNGLWIVVDKEDCPRRKGLALPLPPPESSIADLVRINEVASRRAACRAMGPAPVAHTLRLPPSPSPSHSFTVSILFVRLALQVWDHPFRATKMIRLICRDHPDVVSFL